VIRHKEKFDSLIPSVLNNENKKEIRDIYDMYVKQVVSIDKMFALLACRAIYPATAITINYTHGFNEHFLFVHTKIFCLLSNTLFSI
jgi:hypothetical protein